MAARRLLTLFALAAAGCGGAPTSTPTSLPAGPSAGPVDIRESALRPRLEAFAADSMMGREAGKRGNYMGTEWLARQAAAIGLTPAGENGGWFQVVPMVRVGPDTTSALVAGTTSFRFGTDLLPIAPFEGLFDFGYMYDLADAPVVFAGWPAAGARPGMDVAGSVVVLAPLPGAAGPPQFLEWASTFEDAALLVIAGLDGFPSEVIDFLAAPRAMLDEGEVMTDAPPAVLASNAMLQNLLEGMTTVGPVDATLSGRGGVSRGPVEAPARNVVGILPGRDPALRDQYVALGAHNDHVGVADHPVSHDSLRAFNRVVRVGGAEDPDREATPEEARRIQTLRDSLRAVSRMGPDSIFNGADDDGSGSVTLLAVAEHLMGTEHPRRSTLFVWHTGEEAGLLGSDWFTRHPTVPLDHIVAQINMDMVGRGVVGDLAGGGPDYLQLVGSRRLSTELGDLVERINREQAFGFNFDYTYDADGHEANIYCRSDHASYARFGIPVVFMTTGGHPEYHMVTDEVRYIDFGKMARVASFAADLVATVGNLDHRPVVDGPVPASPDAPCQQ